MPTTASRPPPPSLSLIDDCPRSPPSYNPKHPTSLPSPKPASAPSPRTEKKAPLSPPPEVEVRKLDKSDRRPDLPSDSRVEPSSDPKADSRPSSRGKVAEDDEAKEEETGKGEARGVASKDPIDLEVFGQLLELDEDETFEFSRTMVEDFYSQAEGTFEAMDRLFKSKNLSDLSEKGHFLKGSSAAIGITKVQRSCEEIQNYGKLQDRDEKRISEKEALERLSEVLARVRDEYEEAKTWLNQWFDDPSFRREHEIA
ncbi:hypothetical protein D9756_004824 [Leucocoprinus leucothites]|uniref:HPt domain-containing protein n=1 Tax=Leucocoprinus leucothites TaxID=201217 RepID=A0A8H5G905_9AGAR|nr:hypothetical protein D9756_004824 [Leucoagaricus leucothites]